MCSTCVQCPQRPEEGVRSSETGNPDSCESSCDCWTLNSGCLQEQPAFLMVELSFQLLFFVVFCFSIKKVELRVGTAEVERSWEIPH